MWIKYKRVTTLIDPPFLHGFSIYFNNNNNNNMRSILRFAPEIKAACIIGSLAREQVLKVKLLVSFKLSTVPS